MKVKTPFIAFADLVKPGNQRESCNLKRRLFQWKNLFKPSRSAKPSGETLAERCCQIGVDNVESSTLSNGDGNPVEGKYRTLSRFSISFAPVLKEIRESRSVRHVRIHKKGLNGCCQLPSTEVFSDRVCSFAVVRLNEL